MFKRIIHSVFIRSLLVVISIGLFVACKEEKKKIIINFPHTDLSTENLIPKPLKIIPTHNAFGLNKSTVIYTSQTNNGFNKVGYFLSEKIKQKTGLDIPVNKTTTNTIDKFIYINKSDSVALKNKEAYQLYITKDTIIINAKTAEGAFRGIQTLRQLIPYTSNDTLTDYRLWPIPTGKIIDSPNYNYRGTMLDVARHFFSVADVKKYLDLIAYYKINVLHLHLTDDQGWRIEIKSWPKLTSVGGHSEVGGGKGGFYTQEEYKDIVSYAAERHILIIPEIDMPGHTNAASVSYPFLNGNGKTPKPYTGMRVGFSTFNTKKDTTYSFINNVVQEIAAITPGPYLHIGGDESHVTKKRDYHYFVKKVEAIVNKHNKQVIGWGEIIQATTNTSSVAQHWRTKKNAVIASNKGSKIILSPAKNTYLDMKYDSLSKHGLDWAGHISVTDAYNWAPENYITEIPNNAILGIEAPLWSETISTISELEYLAFPRIIGYAELGWTNKENREWENYKIRLANQVPYLKHMNVNYYPSPLIEWK